VKGLDKTLRGVEIGTRAGWLVLAGLGAFLLWRLLRPKTSAVGTIEEQAPLLPPAPPADASSPQEPRQATAPEGIAAGALVTTLRAVIVSPGKDARVDRAPLSSSYKATIEVVNQSSYSASAQIETVIDYYEFGGAERLGVRTRFPVVVVRPLGVERLEVEIDSGNFNSLTFEFGQADAVARVYTNGKLTQTTSFQVW